MVSGDSTVSDDSTISAGFSICCVSTCGSAISDAAAAADVAIYGSSTARGVLRLVLRG